MPRHQSASCLLEQRRSVQHTCTFFVPCEYIAVETSEIQVIFKDISSPNVTSHAKFIQRFKYFTSWNWIIFFFLFTEIKQPIKIINNGRKIHGMIFSWQFSTIGEHFCRSNFTKSFSNRQVWFLCIRFCKFKKFSNLRIISSLASISLSKRSWKDRLLSLLGDQQVLNEACWRTESEPCLH